VITGKASFAETLPARAKIAMPGFFLFANLQLGRGCLMAGPHLDGIVYVLKRRQFANRRSRGNRGLDRPRVDVRDRLRSDL
jgi:hypothetical protein